MTSNEYDEYFLNVAAIWSAYFRRKISLTERDRSLAEWRDYLRHLINTQGVHNG